MLGPRAHHATEGEFRSDARIWRRPTGLAITLAAAAVCAGLAGDVRAGSLDGGPSGPPLADRADPDLDGGASQAAQPKNQGDGSDRRIRILGKRHHRLHGGFGHAGLSGVRLRGAHEGLVFAGGNLFFVNRGLAASTPHGFIYPFDYYAPLVGVESKIDPNLRLMPPGAGGEEAESTQPPSAVVLLRRGEYHEAARALREMESAGADSEAEEREQAGGELTEPQRGRLLAIALAGDGNLNQAAATLLAAYQHEPGLALRPLDGEALFKGPLELRRLVTSAVRRAHQAESAEAWLLVAVLMQTEGRDRLAAEMLARAERLGLADRILDAWPTPAGTIHSIDD